VLFKFNPRLINKTRTASNATNASDDGSFSSMYATWQGFLNIRPEERGAGLLVFLVLLIIGLLAMLPMGQDEASTSDMAGRKKHLSSGMGSQIIRIDPLSKAKRLDNQSVEC